MEIKIDKFIDCFKDDELMDLFRSVDDVTYVTIRGKTLPVNGSEFRDVINKQNYKVAKKFKTKPALDEITGDCDTYARLFGDVKPVYRRIARTENAVYIDLGTPDFDVIEITGDSIKQTHTPHVKFTRSKIQRAIGGLDVKAVSDDLHLLKKYVNFKTDEDFVLFVGWLLGCMNTQGGYPPLFLIGEQGSAKSTTSSLIKNLLDESTVPLRNLSTGMKNLMIAASNDFILCYDNISKITSNQSDNLCKLSTGAGFTTRKLYTTFEEIHLLCKNPFVINTIALSPTRQDLADRSVLVRLNHIPKAQRKTTQEIMDSWAEDRPKILGALCHAVSAALRNFDQVDVDKLPRMADFTKWVIAAEDGLPWENGTFLETINGQRSTLVDESIDADSTAIAVLKFMRERENWTGSASGLLEELTTFIKREKVKYPDFPKLPNHLSRNLNRISAFLREKGVQFEKKHSGQRFITLQKIEVEAEAVQTAQEAPFTGATTSEGKMDMVRETLGERPATPVATDGDTRDLPAEEGDLPAEEGPAPVSARVHGAESAPAPDEETDAESEEYEVVDF